MITWIRVVDEHGFQEACGRCPAIAGRYTDSMVIEALQMIIADDARWPNRHDKMEAIAGIIARDTTKAEMRAIASRRP